MGPKQSKRCKIRVCRLGLFSFSSKKIQNLTQNASKRQHLQTKHGPYRQLRGLWIYTSVGHALRDLWVALGFKTVIIHPIPFCTVEMEKKICATFAICQIIVVSYFGRKICGSSISRHASFTGNSLNLGH